MDRADPIGIALNLQLIGRARLGKSQWHRLRHDISLKMRLEGAACLDSSGEHRAMQQLTSTTASEQAYVPPRPAIAAGDHIEPSQMDISRHKTGPVKRLI